MAFGNTGWNQDLADPFGVFHDIAQNPSSKTGSISGQTYDNVSQIQGNAQDFRKNMQSYANNASNSMSEQAAGQAQGGDRQIRANASKRGLLYSGLEQGAEAQNRSNISQALMARRAKLNSDLENQAFQNDTNAAGAGLDLANLEASRQKQQFDADKEYQKQNPGLIGGLMGALKG